MRVLISGILLVFFVTLTTSVEAATLYLDPREAEIDPGDTIAVAVRIDTDDGECINAIDGVITYPENISPVDISLGASIFPVWVEEPVIDKKNQRITFAGGIPNGYCGRIEGDPRLTNTIAEIIFQAPGLRIGAQDVDPVAQIAFSSETAVLLNDGAGTPAQLRTIEANILVNTRPTGSVNDEWQERISDDTAPPNPFTISLNSDRSIYAGRYYVVFNTSDKQSGIDHYEIIEEPLEQLNLFAWGGTDTPWITARSPYLLKDQSLNSTIRVRAFDKAGNQYVATLVPDESLRTKSVADQITFAAILTLSIVLLLGLLGLIVWFLRRRIRKRASATIEPVELIDEYDEE